MKRDFKLRWAVLSWSRFSSTEATVHGFFRTRKEAEKRFLVVLHDENSTVNVRLVKKGEVIDLLASITAGYHREQ